MKVKVVNRFVDKETKQLHEYGEVIEVTEERFAEISAAGNYVKALADDTQGEEPLDKMTVAELKEYAKANEIDLGGAKTKAEILEAIKTAEAADADEDAEGETAEAGKDAEEAE